MFSDLLCFNYAINPWYCGKWIFVVHSFMWHYRFAFFYRCWINSYFCDPGIFYWIMRISWADIVNVIVIVKSSNIAIWIINYLLPSLYISREAMMVILCPREDSSRINGDHPICIDLELLMNSLSIREKSGCHMMLLRFKH